MLDQALSILQDLAYTIVFLVSAAASYLALQQPKVRQWLDGTGVLVHVVVFIALANLLSMTANSIIRDLFAFPWGLISQSNGFAASVQCLGGVLVLGGLILGSYQLAQRLGARK